MKVTDELNHLLMLNEPDKKIGGLGIVRFNAFCSGNSNDVLRKCKEVLEAFLRGSGDKWPSDDCWLTILPQWFIQQCSEELSLEEQEKWLVWWRGLSPEEQSQLNKEEQWSLSEWLYWLHPENRQWFWWEATSEDPDILRIAVEVNEWPFPWGSLDWLLRASGAISVKAEE
ncbi:MAG: hypothetical protein ACKPCM_10675 [Pseudanabaena sp.]